MKILMFSASYPFAVRDTVLLRELGHEVRCHAPIWTPADVLTGFRARAKAFLEDGMPPDLTIFWLCGHGSGLWASLPPVMRGRCLGIFGGGEVAPRHSTTQTDWASRRFWTRQTLKHFNAIMFVAEHLLTEALRLGMPMPRRVFIAPTGVDPETFKPTTKEKIAVMAGPYTAPYRLRMKGVDRFLLMARHNPGWEFHLVGVDLRLVGQLGLPNVTFHPFIEHDRNPEAESRYARLLARAQVVLCLSRWEGLPNSLLEGMMADCVPVVTDDVPSLPWAVGDIGIVARAEDLPGLDLGRADGFPSARQRALRLFSLARRREALAKVLAEYENVR